MQTQTILIGLVFSTRTQSNNVHFLEISEERVLDFLITYRERPADRVYPLGKVRMVGFGKQPFGPYFDEGTWEKITEPFDSKVEEEIYSEARLIVKPNGDCNIQVDHDFIGSVIHTSPTFHISHLTQSMRMEKKVYEVEVMRIRKVEDTLRIEVEAHSPEEADSIAREVVEENHEYWYGLTGEEIEHNTSFRPDGFIGVFHQDTVDGDFDDHKYYEPKEVDVD